jgi:hypothetical protein
MNKGRLIGGIACLVVAAALAVLNLVVPGKVYFFVEDQNYPWVPTIVIGIAGIVLVASSSIGRQPAPKVEGPPVVIDPEKSALNKRLESIAWGCFLVMLGGFMFIPDNIVTDGLWTVGVGLIMLGLNLARYLNRLRMSGFTLVLGVLGVLAGLVQIFFLEQNIEGALLLIILGVYLLFKPWFEKKEMIGKAEQA